VIPIRQANKSELTGKPDMMSSAVEIELATGRHLMNWQGGRDRAELEEELTFGSNQRLRYLGPQGWGDVYAGNKPWIPMSLALYCSDC
jgi:hypothetical protein